MIPVTHTKDLSRPPTSGLLEIGEEMGDRTAMQLEDIAALSHHYLQRRAVHCSDREEGGAIRMVLMMTMISSTEGTEVMHPSRHDLGNSFICRNGSRNHAIEWHRSLVCSMCPATLLLELLGTPGELEQEMEPPSMPREGM